MLSTMAWVPRLRYVLGYLLRLLTLWRVSKLTGSGASSPPSLGNPIPICKVLACTSIICALRRLGARGPVVVGALRGLGDVALGERDAQLSGLGLGSGLARGLGQG